MLNFIYDDQIIGEICMRVGTKPASYYPNQFMYNLA